MPPLTAADTIRVLVATDNHVGVNERDPIRGNDSWETFHEIMCLAKERDVDMVLLGGDLFHENKPSRKAMYNVMRSLRINCYGEKPCELEMLSDGSEHFDGTFNHVNYEDPDINVAIPVFSIHGNHDDPSGEGHLAALDILEMSGLVNYFGRIPESDNIVVKPVLLQKGRTKLALYGLSNVRDERMYRTFRDKHATFFAPSLQKEDWFHLLTVHQNHHAYTETSYLPENFLPEIMDLVIWGHEHQCIINPTLNAEMNFQVIQPGSSVATSLVAAEAVPKQVTILSITGRNFKSEPIRLKTVRPFIFRDLVLSQDKAAVRIASKDNHRTELARHLMHVVEGLIEEAKADWQETQAERRGGGEDNEREECPLPLIRLRVDITAPDGQAKFDVENPQRFSNRFINKVANTNDILQLQTRRRNMGAKKVKDDVDEQEVMSHLQALDTIKVDKLVREYLEAQSLTILPQNHFGDAVGQFIDKDDKHAMELFVNESLANQMKHLLGLNRDGLVEDDDDGWNGGLAEQIEANRERLEELFAKGAVKSSRGGKARYKPKPDLWDSDLDGEWEDQPGALIRPDEDMTGAGDEDGQEDSVRPAARGRGRGRGGRAAATASTRKPAAPKKSAAGTGRGRKRVLADDDEDEEEEDDVVMLDDDDAEEEDDDSQAIFFQDTKPKGTTSTRGRKSATVGTRGRKAASPIKKPPARGAAAKAKQSMLNFTSSQASVLGNGKHSKRGHGVGDNIDDDEDDDDAFEPISNRTRS